MPWRWRCTAAAAEEHRHTAYFEGTVVHTRKRPVHHAFKYAVRYCLVDLDAVPALFLFASARTGRLKMLVSLSETTVRGRRSVVTQASSCAAKNSFYKYRGWSFSLPN